jgi:hypothetical protein
MNNSDYLDQMKSKILSNLPTKQDQDEDIYETELVDDNIPATVNYNISTKIVNTTNIQKDDLVGNLLELQEHTTEILEHLKDIVLSELPDSQKITETSKIISNIVDINKTIYDLKFKNSDEVKTDAKKQLNNSMIKKIIEEVHKEKH